MSLAKMIAARMVGAKKPAKRSEGAVAPARSQVHRGAPLPRAVALQREPDIAAVLSAQPLPPAPPPPTLTPALSPGWKGPCKAICADTGRACKLPAHPSEPDRHRHERGPFFRTAVPGQSFTRAQLLEREATRRFTTETP